MADMVGILSDLERVEVIPNREEAERQNDRDDNEVYEAMYYNYAEGPQLESIEVSRQFISDPEERRSRLMQMAVQRQSYFKVCKRDPAARRMVRQRLHHFRVYQNQLEELDEGQIEIIGQEMDLQDVEEEVHFPGLRAIARMIWITLKKAVIMIQTSAKLVYKCIRSAMRIPGLFLPQRTH